MTEKHRRFAEGTSVSVDKTRAELEALLGKHGASQRMVATDDATGRVVVTFRIAERMVRLELNSERASLPDPTRGNWQQAAECPRQWGSWSVARRKEWVAEQIAQNDREAWRRLLLIVKAKLEFIADKMSTVEREFLPDILLPNGRTVGQLLEPQLVESYRTGDMPPLLPGR